MPKAMPNGREMSREKKLIYSVMGILVLRTVQTGTLMATFKDTPQSQSVTTPLRKYRYCTGMGLSR